jgi:hypothetical protein
MRFFLQVVGEEFCDYIRKKRDPTTQGKKTTLSMDAFT